MEAGVVVSVMGVGMFEPKAKLTDLKRVLVHLTPEQVAKARAIGHGKMTEGIRIALMNYKPTQKWYEALPELPDYDPTWPMDMKHLWMSIRYVRVMRG